MIEIEDALTCLSVLEQAGHERGYLIWYLRDKSTDPQVWHVKCLDRATLVGVVNNTHEYQKSYRMIWTEDNPHHGVHACTRCMLY